ANPRTVPRTGQVIIAEQSFTISQAGLPCQYALSPTNGLHGFQAETGMVTVITLDGCSWTAQNTNGWITLLSATNGIGGGAVSYRVAENVGPPRMGTLRIAGATFAVKQGAAQAPVITSQPVSQSVARGATVVFKVGATGSPAPSYGWRFNGTDLADGPTVNGAATAILTLSDVQPAQSGNYAVVASNVRGSVTSAPPAVLRVNTAPALAGIANKVVHGGSRFAFA